MKKRLYSVALVLAGSALTGCGEIAVPYNHLMAPIEEMPTDVQGSARKIHGVY